VNEVWLLEEDVQHEGKDVMGVYTSGEKAERALKRVRKQIATKSGLKIQITGEYADEESLEVVCYQFTDVTRGVVYRARKVPTNVRFGLAH